jgi:hypothetical protein
LSVPPVGPVKVSDRVTAPAKPLVAAGLPRLVDKILTPPVWPVLRFKLVVLVVRVKPLTLRVRIAEIFVVKLVAAWLILTKAAPSFTAAVTLIAFVMVAPAGRVNAAGTT